MADLRLNSELPPFILLSLFSAFVNNARLFLAFVNARLFLFRKAPFDFRAINRSHEHQFSPSLLLWLLLWLFLPCSQLLSIR